MLFLESLIYYVSIYLSFYQYFRRTSSHVEVPVMVSLVYVFTSMSVLIKTKTYALKYQHVQVPQFSGSHIGFIVTINIKQPTMISIEVGVSLFWSLVPICIFIRTQLQLYDFLEFLLLMVSIYFSFS